MTSVDLFRKEVVMRKRIRKLMISQTESGVILFRQIPHYITGSIFRKTLNTDPVPTVL